MLRLRPSRRTFGWLVAWAALTAIGTALHWGSWIAPAESPPRVTVLGAGVFKQVGNFMTIPAAPGWVIVSKVGSSAFGLNLWVSGRSVTGAAFANGIGWAGCLGLLWAALRVRSWMARRGRDCAAAGARGDGGALAREAGDGAGANAGAGESQRVDFGRRRLIVNSIFAGTGVLGTGSIAYGSTVAPFELRVARYRVVIDDLPEGLEGFRIVQVADTHLGPRVPASHVEAAMELAMGLKPDLLALTGDYVHNGFYQIAPAVELFARFMRPDVPVVGVLGNHDWYAGGKAMSEALERIGVRMIDGVTAGRRGGGRVFIDAATRGVRADAPAAGLCIAGVGDLQQDRVDFGAALDGVPEGMPRIVLSHNPDAAEEAGLVGDGVRPARRVDLMLSGHTHGGQVSLPFIGPPIVPSRFGAKYAHGVNRGPACRVLTSAGVGLSLVPLRIGVPPEVVEVILVRSGVRG